MYSSGKNYTARVAIVPVIIYRSYTIAFKFHCAGLQNIFCLQRDVEPSELTRDAEIYRAAMFLQCSPDMSCSVKMSVNP